MINCMIKYLKEIYFTLFVLFYRTPAWGSLRSKNRRNGRAVTGVTLIEWFILLGVGSWISIYFRSRYLFGFSIVAILILFAMLAFANYHFLVIRGHGADFDRDFAHLKKTKKVFLITCYLALIFTTIADFFYSVSVYQRVFHIIPR